MTRAMSIAELANLAAETEDQTEVQVAGEYERELIPAGVNFGRLVEYIETGKHKQPDYQGKPKPPADMIRVTFELLHPKKSIVEYEHEGEKKVRGQLITLRVKKSLSDKASFKKLFNAMTYGRSDIKHMAQMLGELFLFNVIHNTVKGADGKDVTYANLKDDSGYKISAPFIIDPVAETKTPIPCREAISPLRIFLWNNPTKETWDSLYIDGTREVKDKDGTVTHVSKNWLQELCMSAVDYEGSALSQMLHDVSDLPLGETGTLDQSALGNESAAPKASSVQQVAPVQKAGTVASPSKAPPAAAATQKAPAPATAASDALAALGLA